MRTKTLSLFCISLFATSRLIGQTSPQFEAAGLLMLHDADMQAATFSQGTWNRDPNHRDLFSTLTFPLKNPLETVFRSTPVPNSSIRTGKSVVIHPELKLAYVLEHRGGLGKEVTQVSVSADMTDIPAGEFLTLVDFSDLEAPKALYKMPIAKNATSISISPDHHYLAISSTEDEREIEIIELSEDGRPIRIITKPSAFPSGKIVDVQWHPSGDYVAYINATSKTVGILKAIKDGPTGKMIRMEQGDHTLAVGKSPVQGKFSPDGSYFFVMDAKKSKADFRVSEKGELFVIKLNAEGNHFLLSRCTLGENPTDLAVHPNGMWALVTNAEKSYVQGSETPATSATISILAITGQGNATTQREITLEGAIPMSVTWDKTGKHVITGQYEMANFGIKVGGLDFWRWQDTTGKPQLIPQNGKVLVPRGVHSILSIPN
ncbi:MAG: YncE family protein [Spirosomataceae bacterium]